MQNKKLRKSINKNNIRAIIRKKVLIGAIITNSIAFLSIAIFLFFIISCYNIGNFDDKVMQNENNLDLYLTQYYKGLENSINTFEASSNIQDLKNNSITTYVNKSDESGSVKMTPLENGDFEANLYKYFKKFLENNNGFSTVGFGSADNGGYIQYPAEDRKNNYDCRKRPWYESALNADKITYTEANINTNGHLSVAAIKKVVVDSKIIGVLNLAISLEGLSDISQKYKIGDNGFIVILDKNGTVISHGNDQKFISKNVKELGVDGLEEQDLKSNTIKEVNIAGNKYRMFVKTSDKDNLQLTYLSFVEKTEITKLTSNVMFLIGIIAIAFIAVISLVLYI